MPFTEEHDKFILEAYFRTATPDQARNCTYSYQNCEEQFRKQFPDVQYRYTTFQQHCRRVVKRFKKTGSVTKGKTRGRPTLLTERVVDDIRQRIAEGPKKSLRALSAQTNLSLGTVQKACKRALRLHTDKSEDAVVPSQSKSNDVKLENYEWCSDENISDDESSWDSFPALKSKEKEKCPAMEHPSVKQEDTYNRFTENKTLNNEIFGTTIRENTTEIDDFVAVNSALSSEIYIKEESTVDP